ncbi:hypothetical protein TWF696_008436 [Orbilia brochopaga]|uniref:Uncharacterized protein n=1 Tax=Orbilia brochopaga TaxID=3140254 RepID=A0AAV9ULG3_9PEZI
MPRPPRRTAGARRGDKKDLTAATKPVRVDSPAPSSVIPSSPPILRRTRGGAIAKPAAVLSGPSVSDLETVPSTLPLANNDNDNNENSIPESSATVSRVSENTIARANEAASTLPRPAISNIQVQKTPSPNVVIRVADVLSACTPSPIETRGKKRDSKTAFEEDFAASLIAAEDDDEENDATPDTPTRSGSGPRKKRQSLERFSDDEREHPVLNLTGITTTVDKGKRAANPDDTIDFNYSSSPERSPAPRLFGLPKPLEDSDSDSSGSESDDEEERDENQMDEEPQELVVPRPRRKRTAVVVATENTKQADPKHISTKSLQSLLPKRRAKPNPTKSKSKSTKLSKPKSKAAPKEKAPAKPRAALGDVTKDILDEDELQAIDAPPRPLFGAGMDIMSDDELGREIYVDSSARSSSVGAPPTPPSPPPRRTRGGAKGKARAASAEPDTNPGRQPRRRTYGKPRRQDSEVSNKENDTPAGRSSGRLLAASSKLADVAEGDLTKKEKKEVDQIRRKFKEVDRWDLCFEDVIPSSSDGVIAGAR